MSGFEAWAVRAVAAGGLVLLAGWLAARLSRGPARRQAVGAWAVRGAVLAAGVAAFPGWLAVPLPADPPPAVAEAPPEPAPVLVDWAEFAVGVGAPEEVPAATAPAEPPSKLATPGWPTGRVLAAGYAAVAGGLLAHLLLGQVALWRLVRRAGPAPERVRRRYPGRVFVADGLPSPVCFGLLRPTVLLPRGLAEGASGAELGWVLAHEGEHAARGDHRTAWWCGLARCVFFPLPWFWAVRRELVLTQEYLADAAAAGGREADYAAFLVTLSDPPAARLPLLAAGVRAGKSDLFRRVTMLLSDGTGPRRASRRWRLLSAAAAVAGAVTLGGLTPQRAAAEEPKPAQIEVEVRLEDDQPANAEDDKKPEGKPAEKKRTIIVQGKPPEVAKLKEKIKAAAKKGDDEEVAKLVDELEKALRSGPGVGQFRPMPLPPLPPRPPVPPRFDGPDFKFDFQIDGLKEAIRQLESQLKQAGDTNPQAREAMERALESLRGQAARGGRRGPGSPDMAPPQKGRFGVAVGPVEDDAREKLDVAETVGVAVVEVLPESAAAKAGLKAGDVLVKFAGKEVASDPGQFVELVRKAKAGKAEVVVVRKGKKQTFSVELGEAPKPVLKGEADEEGRRAAEAGRRAADDGRRAAEEGRRAADEARRSADADRRKADAEKRRADVAKRLIETRKGGGDFQTVSVSVTDGQFTIKAANAGVRYELTGTTEGGKAKPTKVTVKEGDETFTGDSVDDVPERFRAALKKLLGNVSVK